MRISTIVQAELDLNETVEIKFQELIILKKLGSCNNSFKTAQ